MMLRSFELLPHARALVAYREIGAQLGTDATAEELQRVRVMYRVNVALAAVVQRTRPEATALECIAVAGWASAPPNPKLSRVQLRRNAAELRAHGLSEESVARAIAKAEQEITR